MKGGYYSAMSTLEKSTTALAVRLLLDYDLHHPGLAFADPTLSLTLSEAYEIQFQVAALRQARGETVAGYKIGCVSETVRRQLALTHPVFGHVFEGELHHSGCSLNPLNYEGLAIEGEFAVRLGAHSEVTAGFPIIELHNYVFRAAGQNAQELVANNAIHAGVVLPADEGFRMGSLSVWINGELQGTAEPGPASDQIHANLQALSTHLAAHGSQLKNGQIFLTGSPLPLYRVHPGDQVEVCCGPVTVEATVGR
jgi:2-keto-4-pentenoate hydratase